MAPGSPGPLGFQGSLESPLPGKPWKPCTIHDTTSTIRDTFDCMGVWFTMGIFSNLSQPIEMKGVLVFLEDEGRDILGISLGGVGWAGLRVSYRDES